MSNSGVKSFYFCAFIAFFLLVYFSSVNFKYADDYLYDFESDIDIKSVLMENETKYILEWTSPYIEPVSFLGVGNNGFVKRNCAYTNCFVTSNRTLLSNLSKYHAVFFHGPQLVYLSNSDLPRIRSPHQKFVFASMESSHYYPICSNRLDGYFNWTWTYRLDSDAIWAYFMVTDKNGEVIGPKKNMHWMKKEDMQPVSEDLRKKLKSKSKAAAIFVSNCADKSGRKAFAERLKDELQKYKQSLDIYGRCGTFSCSRNREDDCDKMIDEKYYFYLAFENSFSEDYVTEKLLRALKNNAVPIVYGGANYTRFMPDDIYLDARKLGVEKLAAKMNELINNPEEYAEYFRWKAHYSYHDREGPALNDICNFCALLNNEKKMNEVTIIKDFKNWWDNPDYCYK